MRKWSNKSERAGYTPYIRRQYFITWMEYTQMLNTLKRYFIVSHQNDE